MTTGGVNRPPAPRDASIAKSSGRFSPLRLCMAKTYLKEADTAIQLQAQTTLQIVTGWPAPLPPRALPKGLTRLSHYSHQARLW